MKKTILTAVILFAQVAMLLAGDPNSVRMAKSELTRTPNPMNIDFNTRWKWNYTHGLLLQSLLKVAEKYPTMAGTIDAYTQNYLDNIIAADGSIPNYKKTAYTLDHINPGKMLMMAYDKYKHPRFKQVIDTLYSQLQTHPRTKDGAFWHKLYYPDQVWLDGVYMEAPFLCEYAKRYLSGEEQQKAYNDVVRQVVVAAQHTYDTKTGMYVHAWDEKHEEFWCNPDNGQSPHVWGRALGWYCMAMVDVLEFLPADHVGRDSILSILRPLCERIRNNRDKDYGAWFQVMDEGQRNENYLETSCTIMFAYTFIKGAKNGWLPADFLQTGKESYEALNKHFIREEKDGTISLTRTCAVAGLGGKTNRDGTFEYYTHEPIRDNDPKAVGPYILTSLLLEE